VLRAGWTKVKLLALASYTLPDSMFGRFYFLNAAGICTLDYRNRRLALYFHGIMPPCLGGWNAIRFLIPCVGLGM